MLNDTRLASPFSSNCSAYSSGAHAGLCRERRQALALERRIRGVAADHQRVGAAATSDVGLDLIANLAAQLAGDALHHRLAAADLRRARHQRADDAGAAGFVGILIGEHLHAAQPRRVDAFDQASSTGPSSRGRAPSCATPLRSRRPARRCRSLPVPRPRRRSCSPPRRECGSSRRRRKAPWPWPSQSPRRSSSNCRARSRDRSTGRRRRRPCPGGRVRPFEPSPQPWDRGRSSPSLRAGSIRAEQTARRWCRCVASRRSPAAPPDRSGRRHQG